MTIPRIKPLPPLLVNQIAAGEVIERPASVVKELLENALDAKANQIIVEIGFSGLNSIIISDNGVGIAAEDLPLAVAQHATSKIAALDDLSSIFSLGFRGEALASIASISRFTIQSRPTQQAEAMELRMEGEAIQISPCAREQGTTVSVQDLFFNAPVRKRFLSSSKTEFLAIDKVVRCFALSEPSIKLDFYHQGTPVFQLPKGTTDVLCQHRMQKVLGKSFIEAATFIQGNYSGLNIKGWVADPSLARSQPDRMWTYVNKRMVNDKLLNHAIKQAYDGRLPPGRFPVCLIYVEINPEAIDVNVHPTKHELRFHEPRWVHDALHHLIVSHFSSSITPRIEQEEHAAQVQPKGIAPKKSGIGDEIWDWRTVNSDYALLHRGKEAFLFHVSRFYECYLAHQLKEVEFPLASRPLFVPVSLTLERHIQVIETAFTLLTQVGITLSWLGDSVLLVRSVPILMPHLNLSEFILSILSDRSLGACNQESDPGCKHPGYEILQRLLKHQTLDAGLMTDIEKQNWLAYLSSDADHSSYLKPLSIKNCAVLFND